MLKAEGQILNCTDVGCCAGIGQWACASASPRVWAVSMLAKLKPNMPPLAKCYHEMFEHTFCLNPVENKICFTTTKCNDI